MKPTLKPTSRPRLCTKNEDFDFLEKYVENGQINIPRNCYDWDELMGENFYRSLKICKRIGLAAVTVGVFSISAYLLKGKICEKFSVHNSSFKVSHFSPLKWYV